MKLKSIMVFILISNFYSCKQDVAEKVNVSTDFEQNKINNHEMLKTLEKHLEAVSKKDLATLKSTMSPNGNMQLILPGSEILESVDSFLAYHEDWFKDKSWTFETKIIDSKTDESLGIATTEIMYQEPDRDGKPYFNRMVVTYSLEKINSKWYVIKDHASSIEKSTDQ